MKEWARVTSPTNTMIKNILTMGWIVVEAALLLIVACLTFNIILGAEGGLFITSVAANAQRVLRDVPPGTFVGTILVVGIYWFAKARIK